MTFRFDSFRIDEDRREIWRGAALLQVEPRIFDLLLYLVRHSDRVVTKDELQDEVWGTVVTEAAVARGIMKARKLLGDTTDHPRYLKTIRGSGYRFIGASAEAPSETAPLLARDRRSIAVLPFANMSGNDENRYFSDGIAEEVLNLLAKLPELRVSSRTSSFCFRDSALDLRSIAGKLNVDYVLEGSVRRDGSRVRITVQLIDARDDAHVMSEAFEREVVDIFRLQADIATQVVARLQLATEAMNNAPRDTVSLQAYEHYLRGRHYFHLFDGKSMDYSKLMYRKAIELDSTFAKAWAGLAESLTVVWMWQSNDPAVLEEARSASRRAVELAPELAESRCARGFVLSLQGDYVAAAAEFETSIALDPMLYEAWYLYGRSRFAEGVPAEAARLFRTAAAVRPDEYQAMNLAATALRRLGEHDAMLAASAEGVRRCRQRLALRPDDTRALTLGAGSLVDLGEREEAIVWLERALDIRPNDIGVMHNCGCVYAALGEVDRALDLFERRFALGNAFADWIDNDPDFDGLREHPRFKAIRRTAAAGERAMPTPDAG